MVFTPFIPFFPSAGLEVRNFFHSFSAFLRILPNINNLIKSKVNRHFTFFPEQSRAKALTQSRPSRTSMLLLVSVLLFFLKPDCSLLLLLPSQCLFAFTHMLTLFFPQHSVSHPTPSFLDSRLQRQVSTVWRFLRWCTGHARCFVYLKRSVLPSLFTDCWADRCFHFFPGGVWSARACPGEWEGQQGEEGASAERQACRGGCSRRRPRGAG